MDLFKNRLFEGSPEDLIRCWMPRAHTRQEDLVSLRTYSSERLQLLSKSADGDQDRINSDSYTIWFLAHKNLDISHAVYNEYELRLHQLGYVMWDVGELDEGILERKITDLQRRMPLCNRDYQWRKEEISRSQPTSGRLVVQVIGLEKVLT